MRKILLCFFAITLLLTSQGYAKKKTEESGTKISKEEKQQLKEEKREQKRLQQEEQKKLREEEKEFEKQKKEEKHLQKERADKIKKAEKEKEQEQKRLEKEQEKERKGLEKEEKKRLKEQEKVEQEAEKEEQERLREEEKEARKLGREERKEEKKVGKEETKKAGEEAKREKLEEKGLLGKYLDKLFGREEKRKAKEARLKITTAEKGKMAVQRVERKKEERAETKELKEKEQEVARLRKELLRKQKLLNKKERDKGMKEWNKVRADLVAKDYEDGKFADLYKVPAWQFASAFADHKKDLFQVTTKYDYATGAYSSDGGSVDLSALTFGEKNIQLKDALLALRLREKAILASRAAANDFPWTGPFSGVYRDTTLNFCAQSKEFRVSLDYMRYIKGKDVSVGFQIPFAYVAHDLKLSSSVDSYQNQQASSTNFREVLDYALQPKGLVYNPKTSVTGIGNISTFMNFQINSKYFEKLGVGCKAIWPTAKEASSVKLWAPELGSQFTQFSVYGSALFNHQRSYFNPHLFVQATYSAPANVKRRVPKYVKFDGNTDGTNHQIRTSDNARIDDLMSHGDKVEFVQDSAFTEPDTLVTAFADNVKRVKIQPGPEVNLRLGNMIEKFIFRRAFFDMFYDFRAKWQDDPTGLDADTWKLDALKENTHQIEHKVGCNFSYQFDSQARLQTGLNYTFYGINVPETLQATMSLGIEF